MGWRGPKRWTGGSVPEPFGCENMEKFREIVGSHRSPDLCWPWPYAKHAKFGYGQFSLIGGRTVDASRYSLSVNVRQPVGGEIVRRTCNEKSCVNPAHLYWGTRQKMAKDAVASGYLPLPEVVGEDNAAARLTEEQVMYIRQSPLTGKALAEMFCVSASTISMAQLGETWPHLPGARTRRRVGNPNGGYVER